jgi:GNAT superfamily N-acetyltransferase
MTDRDEPVSDRAEPEPAPEAGGIRLGNLGGAGMLPALAAGVREAGLCLGLDPAPANALQIACRLMMRLIAAANMREGRLPHFELEVLKRPGAVVVRIDDEGLPYELSDLVDRDAGEEVTLFTAFAFAGQLVDEFNYTGRGRLGNRIELVKGIRPDPLIEDIDRAESPWRELSPDAELEVRPMTGGDAIGFARDVYRSYGYSYDNDWAYRAEDIRQMLANETLAGWVVTTPEDGRLIGHIAVRRTTAQDRVGHVGLAMIDPQARRRNLGTQLGLALIKWALDQRMYGVWGEATTIHPDSQRGMLATGGHELALLMSFIPARVNYAAMASHTRRIAVMIAYVRLDDNPVHQCSRHLITPRWCAASTRPTSSRESSPSPPRSTTSSRRAASTWRCAATTTPRRSTCDRSVKTWSRSSGHGWPAFGGRTWPRRTSTYRCRSRPPRPSARSSRSLVCSSAA